MIHDRSLARRGPADHFADLGSAALQFRCEAGPQPVELFTRGGDCFIGDLEASGGQGLTQ